jgi:UDP-N-acetylglucosamine 2-epimerase (non-hydrolysing)
MFLIFLQELNLPTPNYNVNIGSLPNSIQTGRMLLSFYEIIIKELPDIILAQGDTNTVFAAALTAFKNNIPFGHLEAGIRSFDMRMPEEVNRILTSVCTLLNFVPTEQAAFNLLNEGIQPNRIYNVGNTIVDAVYENLEIAKSKSLIESKINLNSIQKLIILTIHRPSNVDSKENLNSIINSLMELTDCSILFPVHPRTKQKLIEFNLYQKMENNPLFILTEPLGYLDFLKLMDFAYMFITDSGGLQEEAVILKKPCLTLRNNTERPESVKIGANILVGNDSQKILKYVKKILFDPVFYKKMIPPQNPFGDGTTSKQILIIIKEKFLKNQLVIPSNEYFEQMPFTKLIHVKDIKDEINVGEYEKLHQCVITEIFSETGEIIFPHRFVKLLKGMCFKGQFLSPK